MGLSEYKVFRPRDALDQSPNIALSQSSRLPFKPPTMANAFLNTNIFHLILHDLIPLLIHLPVSSLTHVESFILRVSFDNPNWHYFCQGDDLATFGIQLLQVTLLPLAVLVALNSYKQDAERKHELRKAQGKTSSYKQLTWWEETVGSAVLIWLLGILVSRPPNHGKVYCYFAERMD